MAITVRAYNVLFGDCLLVSWDEDDGEHHAWIDFGNFHNDRNDVFDLAYEDVLKRTRNKDGEHVLDLVVITHRHLDHLEGFHTLRDRFAKDFRIKKLWYSHVTKALDDQFKIAEGSLHGLMPASAREGDGDVGRMYRNNFGMKAISTKQRMQEILNTLCPEKDQHAVHRESNLKSILPPGLKRLKISILAPERDSGVYLAPLADALRARKTLDRYFKAAKRKRGPLAGGITAGGGVPAEKSHLMQFADFARLYRLTQTGGMDLLAAVDRTRNNTSVVLALTYDGKKKHRLLFPGDAEETSWTVMRRGRRPLDADLIKVAHHGSINASPEEIFTKVFPARSRSNAVLISTDETRYPSDEYENEVPNEDVLLGWSQRLKTGSRLRRTDKISGGKRYVSFLFY